MDIDPAGVAVLGTVAGGVVGFLMGWLAKYKTQAKAARPAIMLDGEDIVITNTLDEQIRLVKIAANSQFALAFKGPRNGNGNIEAEHWFRRSRDCAQDIMPRSQARLQILLKKTEKTPVVYLTFSSNGGILKRERIRVRMPA